MRGKAGKWSRNVVAARAGSLLLALCSGREPLRERAPDGLGCYIIMLEYLQEQ